MAYYVVEHPVEHMQMPTIYISRLTPVDKLAGVIL